MSLSWVFTHGVLTSVAGWNFVREAVDSCGRLLSAINLTQGTGDVRIWRCEGLEM